MGDLARERAVPPDACPRPARSAGGRVGGAAPTVASKRPGATVVGEVVPRRPAADAMALPGSSAPSSGAGPVPYAREHFDQRSTQRGRPGKRSRAASSGAIALRAAPPANRPLDRPPPRPPGRSQGESGLPSLEGTPRRRRATGGRHAPGPRLGGTKRRELVLTRRRSRSRALTTRSAAALSPSSRPVPRRRSAPAPSAARPTKWTSAAEARPATARRRAPAPAARPVRTRPAAAAQRPRECPIGRVGDGRTRRPIAHEGREQTESRPAGGGRPQSIEPRSVGADHLGLERAAAHHRPATARTSSATRSSSRVLPMPIADEEQHRPTRRRPATAASIGAGAIASTSGGRSRGGADSSAGSGTATGAGSGEAHGSARSAPVAPAPAPAKRCPAPSQDPAAGVDLRLRLRTVPSRRGSDLSTCAASVADRSPPAVAPSGASSSLRCPRRAGGPPAPRAPRSGARAAARARRHTTRDSGSSRAAQPFQQLASKPLSRLPQRLGGEASAFGEERPHRGRIDDHPARDKPTRSPIGRRAPPPASRSGRMRSGSSAAPRADRRGLPTAAYSARAEPGARRPQVGE